MELWFTERHTDAVGLTLKIKKSLYSRKTSYQQIDVLETTDFGRMLLLDGLVMTTEADEYIYHEMLVHPAMHLHGNAKRVMVIGGGDGGAVREILRYGTVEEVILCEIDRAVVEVAREFFPSISCALDDDRVRLVFEDGARFLKKCAAGHFDLIFVDSTDPIGAAKALFSMEFYELCLNCLNTNGMLVAQSESPFYHTEIMRDMKKGMEQVGFLHVHFYTAPVPTYPGGYWSWLLACRSGRKQSVMSVEGILTDEEYDNLRYYNLDVHSGAFCLPNFLKKALNIP